jgi:hypothetical protein
MLINDYSKYKTTLAEPEASSMIETFRAIGYSIQAAVADIVDNSVSAGAKNIRLEFGWKGPDTWISIKDDGVGMDNQKLIQAMRPGSRNPKEERNSKDLGRFGLGLKTASFSQCKQLSVISKMAMHDPIICWTWDLDFVVRRRQWDLIDYIPPGFEHCLDEEASGTVVIWNDLDRLVKDLRENDSASYDKFLQVMENVKKHLGMVFHRFIENNRIKIYFQKRLVEAWSPFLVDNSATQKFPEEPLQNNKVRIRGFVLPHQSKLTEEEFRNAEGPRGWNDQQGFYIYRNERLLLAGDWLGMLRKEEYYKLARIMVDLPNDLDTEWQIDIKKSIARPPIGLRDQLKAYANKVRLQAVEVYRHKGKVLQRKYAATQFQPVWQEKAKHGKRFYEINRAHPLISNLHSKELEALLRLLEETVPIPLIVINESEHPDSFNRPFEKSAPSELKELLKTVYNSLLNNNNTTEQAKSKLLLTEPFNEYPELIVHL